MTSAVSVIRTNFFLTTRSGLILLCFAAFGWVHVLMQLVTLNSIGSLSEAGPGMQIFSAFQYYLLNDPFGFQTSLNFCTTTDTDWGILDFLKSFTMWVAMVFAMMLPGLFPLLKSVKSQGQRILPFILSYLSIWLGFCVLGVAVQWALRLLEILNGHMVITNPVISAATLCIAGGYQLSQTKSARLTERKTLIAETYLKPCCQTSEPVSGSVYGLACIICCLPMMLTMFAFGLMNILAMVMLTVMMILETNPPSRIDVTKLWGAMMCFMGLLFLV